jgi:cell volume regulation protein A
MESIDHAILLGAVVMTAGILLGVSRRASVSRSCWSSWASAWRPGRRPRWHPLLQHLAQLPGGQYRAGRDPARWGLRTRLATFRVALRPSLSLATLGVVITAVLVGAFASWLLGIDWKLGLLLGAIVGSTDAAVFSLLNGSGVRLTERVASVLEIESGINDPMAIFLTLTLIEWITSPQGLSPGALVTRLVVQFGVGGMLGAALGYCLANVMERVNVAEGLQAILVCSGGCMVWAIVQTAGGSGFLAVYLTGMIVGNREHAVSGDTMRAMDGMAWLAQSAMFLLLGLLVSPHRIWDIALPAAAVALFLMCVARPVSVWISLLPFRFNAREKGFVAWMGLRGAVPIVLSLFPMLQGMKDSGLLFRVAFAVVLASLLCQGTTVALAARLARVLRPLYNEPLSRERMRGTQAPALELMQFEVAANSPVDSLRADQLELPMRSRLMTVARDGALVPLDRAILRAGDIVSVLAPGGVLPVLSRLFLTSGPPPAWDQVTYDFLLAGQASLADVAALYGTRPLLPHEQLSTLEQAMLAVFRSPPVEGMRWRLPACG